MNEYEKLAIDPKEEGTRDLLTQHDSDGVSSTMTAKWDTIDTCYVVGVPHWWKESVLKEVPGKKHKDEMPMTKINFNTGDIRMSTWRLLGARTDRHPLQGPGGVKTDLCHNKSRVYLHKEGTQTKHRHSHAGQQTCNRHPTAFEHCFCPKRA